MGLFSIFKKNTEPTKVHNFKNYLFASFSNLKNDLDNQNKWVNYLHKAFLDVKNTHNEHKYSTKASIEKVHTNLSNIHKWIDHLHTSNKQHTERLSALEGNMKLAFDKYNNHLMDLFKQVSSRDDALTNDLRKQLKAELLLELQSNMVTHRSDIKEHLGDVKQDMKEAYSRLNELSKVSQIHGDKLKSHMEKLGTIKKLHEKRVAIKASPSVSKVQTHVVSQPVEKQVEVVYNHTPLTNPEQKLLNILFVEQDPVNYSQLSAKTGHSINTVRVNMNFLKKKGFIEENLLPTGVKLFNLKNKERIKKMYNLQHI